MDLRDLFDWHQVRTKVMTTIVLSLGFLVYPVLGLWEMYQEFWGYETTTEGTTTTYRERHEVLAKEITEQSKKRDDNLEGKLDILLENQARDYKLRTHLEGTAALGSFGRDRSYIQVNRGSDAKVYRDGDEVRVTITNIDGNPRTSLTVDGTFNDPNSDVLIRFSRRAADDLGVSGRCNVQIEPVEKK